MRQGTLDALLEHGYKYMFVSNSDNLGATMDLKLLTVRGPARELPTCDARTPAVAPA